MEKKIIKKICFSLVFLYFFLLSIKLMSYSFKIIGGNSAEALFSLTANPFVALFIGILATSIVQSSSFVTALVVGFVATGSLTLTNAIPIIMGANIGTTITNMLVSITHVKKKQEFRRAFEAAILHDIHNVLAVVIFFPLEIYFHLLEKSSLFIVSLFFSQEHIISNVSFSSPLNYVLAPSMNLFKYLFDNPIALGILSLIMLFLSLGSFVNILKPLAKTEFRDILHNSIFKHPKKSFAFSILLTAIIQSSSVTTSLVIPFVGTGMLTLEAIYPYLLGANIGTTITAILASLALGSSAALAVALVHLLFNLFSCIVIYPFRFIPIYFSKKFGETILTSRIIPFIYVAIFFFLIPFLIIFL